ncbi:MAG: RluA family pseudouridine synthase [Patescibacteria group bacterium]
MNIKILFEDQDILIISKPAGVVVNRAENVKSETLQDWMAQRMIETLHTTSVQAAPDWQNLVPADFDSQYGSPEEIFKKRSGMVHRLDKDTSGVMVFAKNPGSLVSLLKEFKERRVKKEYLCLTHGKFSLSQDEISAPIERHSQDREKYTVAASGRNSVTRYQVELFYFGFDANKLAEELSSEDLKTLKRKEKSYQGFSLVKCKPLTGRTHQIRVHMSHIKHPLVGDQKYWPPPPPAPTTNKRKEKHAGK